MIEAFRYNGETIVFNAPKWLAKSQRDKKIYFMEGSPHKCFIKTLEGDMHVSVGDYIIKGVDGELYPCKPDIFEKTYEIVE